MSNPKVSMRWDKKKECYRIRFNGKLVGEVSSYKGTRVINLSIKGREKIFFSSPEDLSQALKLASLYANWE